MMAARVAEICRKNSMFIILDTYIPVCAFVSFVTVPNFSMHGHGLCKKLYS